MNARPEIQVYASFPLVTAPSGELNLDADNWHWVHCLTLPLETLDKLQFSPKPYKWICYAVGIAVGAEGNLSFTSDSLNVVDYNAGLPAESAALYYHTSDDEKRRMFPIDPKVARTNVTSSVATSRRPPLRSDVAGRDGHRCVLTGMHESSCEAVHLLAHSKGDTYISMYTERRSRDPVNGELIQDIDSIRNCILLNKTTHPQVGKNVAFLPTPNFAMNTADVNPTAPPGEKRYTAHLFEPSEPGFLNNMHSGSPLRSSNTPDWPPGILFDAVYASAVIYHFGTQELIDVLAATWMNIFYPDGVMDRAHAESKSIADERAFREERRQRQAQERDARHRARAVSDTFDMLLALPYILVPRNELQAMFREAEEKAALEEQGRVQEKVDT